MLAGDQISLLSAGLRHQEDAQALLVTSPDQSWHLAGFAPECARKACVTIEPLRKALGHEQGADADALLEIAFALDGRARRLPVTRGAPAGTPLARWRPDHRYDATGSHAPDAPALVRQTSGLLDSLLAALWLAAAFDPGNL